MYDDCVRFFFLDSITVSLAEKYSEVQLRRLFGELPGSETAAAVTGTVFDRRRRRLRRRDDYCFHVRLGAVLIVRILLSVEVRSR